MICIYVNDKKHPFTQQMMNLLKAVETRTRRTLNRYCEIPVGIIRTGKGKNVLVGECVFHFDGEYESVEEFDRCFREHRIPPESDFHLSKCKHRYKYRITDVVPYDVPRNVEIKVRHGRTACEI